MAGEFRIKTGLSLGATPTQTVISIQNASTSIVSDASSILVTGKAIFDYVSARSQATINYIDGSLAVVWTKLGHIDTSLNNLGVKNANQDVSLNNVWTKLGSVDTSLNNLGIKDVTQDASIVALRTKDTNIDTSLNAVWTKFGSVDTSLNNLGIKDAAQDASIVALRTKDTNIDTSLNNLGIKDAQQDASIVALRTKDTNIDTSLNAVWTKLGSVDTSLNNLGVKNAAQDTSLNAIWTKIGSVDTSLNNLGIKDAAQDTSISIIRATYIPNASLNTTTFKWVAGLLEPSIATGGGTFASLTDGSIVNPLTNDTLKYNATSGKWHNKPDLWDLSTNDSTVYLNDPSDNLQLSYIEMQENGGAVLLVDMPCASTTAGSEQSYSMTIDGSNALKIYGVSASTALSETAVVVETTYFALGDPTNDGSWRFRVDASGLQIEKRVSGSWLQKGQFS